MERDCILQHAHVPGISRLSHVIQLQLKVCITNDMQSMSISALPRHVRSTCSESKDLSW